MKRRLTQFVLFLLLGAIVNVAVAWTCVVTVPIALRPAETTIRQVSADYQQVQCIQRAFGRTRESWVERYTWPVLIDYERAFALGGGAASWERTGWPMRALFCSISANAMIYRTDGGEEVFAAGSDGQVDAGIELSPEQFSLSIDSVATWRALPLRPIWPGFAINTIFYATVLSLLWSSPFVVRRLIRRKRGHCIKCGYDLRGTSGGGGVCPECGATTR